MQNNFGETTMDPEKRILNQIDLDEAMEADMILIC